VHAPNDNDGDDDHASHRLRHPPSIYNSHLAADQQFAHSAAAAARPAFGAPSAASSTAVSNENGDENALTRLCAVISQLEQQLKQKSQELAAHQQRHGADVQRALAAQRQQHEQALQQKNAQLAAAQQELQQHQQQMQAMQQSLSAAQAQHGGEKQRADHLQAELAAQRNDLHARDQRIALIQAEINTLKTQLVFSADSPWRLNLAAAGVSALQQQQHIGQNVPISRTTPLYNFVEGLMRTRGKMQAASQGVAGFSLVGVDVVVQPQGTAGFEDRLRRLQQLRQNNGAAFNPPATTFDPEQTQVLDMLKGLFVTEKISGRPNVLFTFHGTYCAVLSSVLQGLVAIRNTDAGYFGARGIYSTNSIEYAAWYASGNHLSPFPVSGQTQPPPKPAPRSDGAVPVVMLATVVGLAYPVTVADVQVTEANKAHGPGHTKWYGMPLNKGFDAHVVPVISPKYLVCPAAQAQYLEVVCDQENAVLPIAVLWLKP
jgi:hypothetical protein